MQRLNTRTTKLYTVPHYSYTLFSQTENMDKVNQLIGKIERVIEKLGIDTRPDKTVFRGIYHNFPCVAYPSNYRIKFDINILKEETVPNEYIFEVHRLFGDGFHFASLYREILRELPCKEYFVDFMDGDLYDTLQVPEYTIGFNELVLWNGKLDEFAQHLQKFLKRCGKLRPSDWSFLYRKIRECIFSENEDCVRNGLNSLAYGFPNMFQMIDRELIERIFELCETGVCEEIKRKTKLLKNLF